MTKDEARPLVRNLIDILDASKDQASARAEAMIVLLQDLGMLTLDEPKSAQQKFDAIFSLYRLEDAKLKAHEFLAYLDEAGLKIVDK